MNTNMQYKGYVGSIEYSDNDKVYYGKVHGIHSLISYEGVTVQDLIKDFHAAVDEYLSLCKREGVKPESVPNGTTLLTIER